MVNLKKEQTKATRINDVNWDKLGFGVYFSDHVFVSDFADGKWDEGRIIPYGPMEIEPSLCTLHYGQTIFEGMKAFRDVKGGVNLFRPDMNAARLNHSGSLVCIPPYDEKMFIEAIKEIVRMDEKWIPTERGQSLYIRPLVYGSGNFLGVHASATYKMIIMTSPVASYYAEGLNPVKILVSSDYVRAVRGGLGTAKTAANYAASILAGTLAKKEGYSQVLWLDGVSRHFIDEVGAMNIMFVIDDEIITPSLAQGSILAGVTRDTVLTLAREWGLKVSERQVTIDELVEAHSQGRLKEAFGTGTAAVISPVGMMQYNDKSLVINDMKIGPLAQRFYDTITGIQYGEIEDTHGWTVHIDM